jgi:hypothetical protein
MTTKDARAVSHHASSRGGAVPGIRGGVAAADPGPSIAGGTGRTRRTCGASPEAHAAELGAVAPRSVRAGNTKRAFAVESDDVLAGTEAAHEDCLAVLAGHAEGSFLGLLHRRHVNSKSWSGRRVNTYSGVVRGIL